MKTKIYDKKLILRLFFERKENTKNQHNTHFCQNKNMKRKKYLKNLNFEVSFNF